ncbi:MAG: hypothetical protein ACRC9Q_04365 [Bacteroidales bacterium]
MIEITKQPEGSVYEVEGMLPGATRRFILTTPETRAICNDPRVLGMDYTRKLQKGCEFALRNLVDLAGLQLNEKETVVYNILRGGLNFGLRDSLSEAFGWNAHSSSFISAQRRRCADNPDEWEIVEGDYHKLYLNPVSSIVFGDVVATGTSLYHGMEILLDEVKKTGVSIRNIVFFTIGGEKTEEILSEISEKFKAICPEFEGTYVVYIEGCFVVPVDETPLHIKITGTDLIKRDALMAPEYVASQYENPLYPLERCTIYDAGSRAFLVSEYAEDLLEYWKEMKQLAEQGISFETLVSERTPMIDPLKFGNQNLKELAQSQIDFFENYV